MQVRRRVKEGTQGPVLTCTCANRDFVFSWYSKITNDRTFVDEVINVIAHTTRSLEQRLRQIDLEVLLLDELPALLDSHVRGRATPPTHPCFVSALSSMQSTPLSPVPDLTSNTSR